MKNFFNALDTKIRSLDPDYIVMMFCVVLAIGVGSMAAKGML